MFKIFCTFILCTMLTPRPASAGVEGGISGTVVDPQGIAVSGATVQVADTTGKVLRSLSATATGDFSAFPLDFGDYQVMVTNPGFAPYAASVHVSSDHSSPLAVRLALPTGQETVLKVRAKRHLISSSASVSSQEIGKEQIEKMPQGSSISLPKLLYSTNPGMIQGSFGQVFTRGNHANLQYQIDGVQLPDSTSGTFGDAFSPLNIERMEVITGGIPAEYGDRLAGVVNIISKTGPEVSAGLLELNYGSFNQFSPILAYGGSNNAGDLHYFFSGNYNQTDRGLDTPQPLSQGDQSQGGRDVVHDASNGDNEFFKLDWLAGNSDKITLVLFNEKKFFQIPNYPGSFNPADDFFQSTFTDQFGNDGGFNYSPPNTNASQTEANDYVELVWKHSFGDHDFLQVAPYWKYSSVLFHGDPDNDLAGLSYGGAPTSFSENRRVNNLGLKTDYTLRSDDRNLIKAGFQIQGSQSSGPVTVIVEDPNNPGSLLTSSDDGIDKGYQEGLYVQDDIQISKAVVLNAGLRYDAIQFVFADSTSLDYLLQPRLGLSVLVSDSTKLHLFYGKLFQPAPAENLRDTFNSLGEGQLTPYDLKAEKDDYYEAGMAQQLGDSHVLSVNTYYKDAVNMLDDAQLLNTAISQPFNLARGYAYGTEISLRGKLFDVLSDYINYSYEIAEGQGLSGGIFAFPAGTDLGGDYQMLDHVQINTVNGGLTYSQGSFWLGASGLYGSGLRTGADNTGVLPAHFIADSTVGYAFQSESWIGNWKLSGDVLNIFDNAYPITVANGFNGSHYSAGRTYMVHLTKNL
jgi:outer membrane receptor for ferrienterochelin and colicin